MGNNRKITRFIVAVIAAMLCMVLFVSVITRYHHHDYNGTIHYCLVCDHEQTECNDICAHNTYNHQDANQSNWPCGNETDDTCALHIDNFFLDNSHHSYKHHCDLHQVCGCFSWVAVLTGYYSFSSDCVMQSELYVVTEDDVIDPDLHVDVARGPPVLFM